MSPLLDHYQRESIIGQAYAFAEEAHRGVLRASGEPYFTHCLEVAETVHGWNLDEASVAAALLHDVVEDTSYTLKDIESRFGPEITTLVEGLTKLKHLTYPEKERKVENLRRFVISFCRDLRVLIVKLADRLHNMRTLDSLGTDDQKKIAWETLEIYAPLAYRLGMQRLSGELDDFAFPFVYPEEHRWLVGAVKDSYETRLRYAQKLVPLVEKALAEHHISPVHIDARAKRYYSLYRKLHRYDMDLEKIHDLVALRVIVPDIEACYTALGAIHGLWSPLPNQFDDYISRPKPNGYRSLHTTVFCVDHKITEFQIRTQEMHDEAELGIAAHWGYQQIKSSKYHAAHWQGIQSRHELLWVEQLRNWQKTFTDHAEFVDSVKTDFFKDRIFVVTPQNDVIDLPIGSTPVDFAYRIHSDIGDACVGAKVNGKIAQLEEELHSGDVVEILTRRGKKPSEGWLAFLKTELARKHVKSALRGSDRKLKEKLVPKETEFKITNLDRPGYLKDVTVIFAKQKINITYLQSQTDHRSVFSLVTLRCTTLQLEKIEKILVQLKRVEGTKEVSYKTSR
jgi:GTP pyrophosphokinase